MNLDDEERQLREAIARLQVDYVSAAKPYVDRLVELNNMRVPIIVLEDSTLIEQPWNDDSLKKNCVFIGGVAKENADPLMPIQSEVSRSLPIRAWINQPSRLQPLHRLHGTNVLAVADDPGYFRAYFLSGDTIAMRASDLSLSLGWTGSH